VDKSVKLALIAYIEYLILIDSTGIVYLKHLGKNENCMQSFWISIQQIMAAQQRQCLEY